VILAGEANGFTGAAIFCPFGVVVAGNGVLLAIWCQIFVFEWRDG
jgi:hypothetical protein